jgi:hypothetical protein
MLALCCCCCWRPSPFSAPSSSMVSMVDATARAASSLRLACGGRGAWHSQGHAGAHNPPGAPPPGAVPRKTALRHRPQAAAHIAAPSWSMHAPPPTLEGRVQSGTAGQPTWLPAGQAGRGKKQGTHRACRNISRPCAAAPPQRRRLLRAWRPHACLSAGKECVRAAAWFVHTCEWRASMREGGSGLLSC